MKYAFPVLVLMLPLIVLVPIWMDEYPRWYRQYKRDCAREGKRGTLLGFVGCWFVSGLCGMAEFGLHVAEPYRQMFREVRRGRV